MLCENSPRSVSIAAWRVGCYTIGCHVTPPLIAVLRMTLLLSIYIFRPRFTRYLCCYDCRKLNYSIVKRQRRYLLRAGFYPGDH